ncbi:MAG: cell division protein SepF [Actinomycetales bacterium]|nr:MAG: cell division protein SepF [Actinomycetales bacterium]
MAGALRKTMVYLGLAEEDEYDYDQMPEDTREQRESRGSGAAVTPLPNRSVPVAQVVRETEMGPLSRITTIHPSTYNEAKAIGESFRDGIPVIMNLSDMDDADAKRLVDFAAGLVFGLHGGIERVTAKVFLLSPAHVEVTADDETPGGEPVTGPFNQS